jgi:SHS family lactate transporter-like MFS transporter
MSSTESWGPAQRHVVAASFLGWMLDAFDFFLVVFVLKRIAGDFGTEIKSVTWAIFLTLAMRPIGAFLFGRLADRYGRRPALMASVLSYSIMEFASAFAPTLTVFLVLRAFYGIAMGGEWGVGASLAFESVPVRSRGLVSGILQAGYPSGYLLAAIVYGTLFDHIGWRGMFMVGVPGASGALHPQQGAGIGGLDRQHRARAHAKHLDRAQGTLAAGAVRHRAHDGI